jgi:hypothetical protein
LLLALTHERSQARDAPAPAAAAAAHTQLPPEVEALSEGEAVARLRALGHPATLFGEGVRDRLLRLHVVQRSIAPRIADELGQGQQANEKQRTLRELEQAAKVRSKQAFCACLGADMRSCSSRSGWTTRRALLPRRLRVRPRRRRRLRRAL